MSRRSALAVLALGVSLVVIALPTPWATAQGEVAIRGVDTGDFPLVRLSVSTGQELSLTARDVEVVENGVLVEVTGARAIGEEGQPVEAVLAIDVSNSMQGERLATALAAARTFIATVPEWMPVGILTFAELPDVLVPLDAGRAAAEQAVSSMDAQTSRGTALFDAVAAASAMFDTEGDAQHNLILVTDGRNTAGARDLAAAVATAEEFGVNVFTIGLAGSFTDEETLGALARETGGSYAAISPDELTAVYEGLAEDLVQQHVVEYRSKAPFGAPVTVSVHVPSGVATTGFLAPGVAQLPAATRGGEAAASSILSGPLGMALVAALTFLAVFSLILYGVGVINRRRREEQLKTRLPAWSPESEAFDDEPERATTLIPQQLSDVAERTVGASREAYLARRLKHAGWSLRVGEFLLIVAFATVGGVVLGAFLFGPIAAVIGALVAGNLPFILLSGAASRRVSAMQAQLADTLMVIASSMRAGHSFLQSLDTAAKEIGEPAATEFSRALTEIRLGRDVDGALENLVERVGSQDLEWAVTAIKVQRKIGGNLAEVLETVAKTIRERETLRRQVKVLSAEGRISVAVLCVLPVLVAAYLMVVNPDYLRTLINTRAGMIIISVAGSLMLIGFVWMRRMVKLDA